MPLAIASVCVADAAVLLAGVLLIRAYRRARPVRQTVGLLFFSLVIAHLSGYLLVTRFEQVRPWANSPTVVQIFQTQS
jgi:hypothetical protein